MKTYSIKAAEIEREWWVVDAAGKPVGRVAAQVAAVLRGKHKPIFTPHADTGDHVIIINAAQAVLTGNNKPAERLYRHSGYPGGLKSVTRGEMMQKQPERYLERVIRGMLPHNRLGAQMYRKLKVYAGSAHPHQPQAPKPLTID